MAGCFVGFAGPHPPCCANLGLHGMPYRLLAIFVRCLLKMRKLQDLRMYLKYKQILLVKCYKVYVHMSQLRLTIC